MIDPEIIISSESLNVAEFLHRTRKLMINPSHINFILPSFLNSDVMIETFITENGFSPIHAVWHIFPLIMNIGDIRNPGLPMAPGYAFSRCQRGAISFPVPH